jgi:hypothetical protein
MKNYKEKFKIIYKMNNKKVSLIHLEFYNNFNNNII